MLIAWPDAPIQDARQPLEAGMDADQRSARITGVLFLITFATSIAALYLYQPVLDDPRAYTKPWTVTIKERLIVEAELIDEICLENEQSLRHMK